MTTLAADLEQLLARFQEQPLGSDYNEASLRNDFLNPLWSLLGWDLENQARQPQSLREVAIEPAVHVAGRKKRADYVFRINGLPRFVCEAKAPGLELGAKDAFQAQRYAFNLGVHVAVLTNFRHTHVYAVGGRPDRLKPFPPVLQWNSSSLPERAEELEALLGRGMVADGSLEKFLQELPKRPRGERGGWVPKLARTRAVDREFLDWLEEQRLRLARDAFKRNPTTSSGDELNLISTRVIDRLLFLRICEDRDISVGTTLRELKEAPRDQSGEGIYEFLKRHFKKLRKTFNGVLFDTHLADAVSLGDSVLTEIIEELTDDDSAYLFSVLPVEVLGSVYERFLAHTLVVKSAHLKLEKKPEVKRAGGIYYTPEVAVGTIVQDTVRRLVSGRAPAELAQLRILDLACGSGAFLVKAFDTICDAYIDYYRDHPKACVTARTNHLVQGSGETFRLTSVLKRQICVQNIFGVDIDGQAVEVSMMSLYLKMLEGETTTTLGASQTNLFDPHLPDLRRNIQRGNSVVGTDFADHGLDEGAVAELGARRPLDWNSAFPEVMQEGGFSAVVGNPPYVRPHRISAEEKKYFWKVFELFRKKSDLYVCFVERALFLLRPEGQWGYILSRGWLTHDSFQPLRKHLLESLAIREIIECPDDLFESAKVRTVIVTGTRKPVPNRMPSIRVEQLQKNGGELIPRGRISQATFAKTFKNIFDLSLSDSRVARLHDRIRKAGKPLGQDFDVRFGLKTGDDERFLHMEKMHSVDRPIITGQDVQRWSVTHSGLFVHYDPAEMRRHRVTARPGEPERFEGPKVLVKDTTNLLAAAYDDQGLFAKDVLIITPKPEAQHSLLYVAGILNSRLMTYYFRSSFDTVHVQNDELSSLPVLVEGRSRYTKRIEELAGRLSRRSVHLPESTVAVWQAELDVAVEKLFGLRASDIALLTVPA